MLLLSLHVPTQTKRVYFEITPCYKMKLLIKTELEHRLSNICFRYEQKKNNRKQTKSP